MPALEEELFHAYQDHFYNNGISNQNRLNIEYEAKFAEDLGNAYYSTPGPLKAIPKLPDGSEDLNYPQWLYSLVKDPTGSGNPVWPNMGSSAFQMNYYYYMGEFGSYPGTPYPGIPDENLQPLPLVELKGIYCPGGPNDPYH